MPDASHDAFGTRAVRAGLDDARSGGATDGALPRLERAVASLEGAHHAVAFASGAAVVAAVAQLAPAGTHILAGDDAGGVVSRYLDGVHGPVGGGVVQYADIAGDPEALWSGLAPTTRLVWLASPSSPWLRIPDVGIAALELRRWAHQAGPDVVRPRLVVDSTAVSPALGRPIALGADIAVHLGSCALSGLEGAAVGLASTSDETLAATLRFVRAAMGTLPTEAQAVEVLRGLPTLEVRMERQSSNAFAVARFLAGRPDVGRVRYPGLNAGPHAHLGHAVAARQFHIGGEPTFGPLVAFVPASGGHFHRTAAARATVVAEATRLFTDGRQPGGAASRIDVPVSAGGSRSGGPRSVDPALVWLSVGLEEPGDLLADLAQALDRA